MTGRRVALISSATASLAVAALMTSAAPANAATYTVDVVVAANCSATSSLNLPGVLAPGDVIVFNPSGPGVGPGVCGIRVAAPSGNLTGWTYTSSGSTTNLSGFTGQIHTLMSSSSFSFVAGSVAATTASYNGNTFTNVTTIATWSLSGGGFTSSTASPAVAGATPTPIIQQFGRPRSGTCGDAAPAALNWGGASSGGWGESWAQWANGGAGGAVCTRTLQYSNATGIWSVG
jgi:hypothetical protein